MHEILNISIDTDSYKFSQWLQYPKDMKGMYSYFESRGGYTEDIVFFGLQYLLKKYLTKIVTVQDVEFAKVFAKAHGVPYNYEGWLYIAEVLEGKIPVKIKAVPEGMVIPVHNILMSVESTDDNVPWIVNWTETLLTRVWYSISVATLSRECAKRILPYERLTVDDDKIILDMMFKLNDFGSRGATSQESSMVGGASHLTGYFAGSDTIPGIIMANKYYNCNMSGYSIPASEHSTVTSWGRNNESIMMKNMMDVFKSSPIVACVSDSYNYYNSVDKIWGIDLREEILGSDKIRICRPDSGDPIECVMYALNSFEKSYGTVINSKGYKVLNNMRVIQGDGINIEDITDILKEVTAQGFSVENVNFGMGGGLLQKYVNRDTHKFAFKCSEITLSDGESRGVCKDPITSKGKKSKSGRLALIYENGSFKTVNKMYCSNDILQTVFQNGKMIKEYTLDEVRKRSSKGI